MGDPVGAVLPADTRRFYGAKAEAMQEKLEEHRATHDGENAYKHAVVLNMNPFLLKVESGHTQYIIDACPDDKDFAAYEIETARLFTKYRSTRENLNGLMERDYDLLAISPIEQALEFHTTYNDGIATQRPMGGVIVFEGTKEDLAGGKDLMVREPQVTLSRNGKVRVVKFREVLLFDLIKAGRAKQKVKTLEKIADGQKYYNDPKLSSYLDDEHRKYARFAYRQKWITKLPEYCGESTTAANLCDGCGNEYKSKTGKCQCGHVMYPLLAFEKSAIEFTHVRMDSLDAAEWKKAIAIKEKRDKMRGVN